MPVRSLLDLASAACIKNIRHLESVGDYLPYDNVRHILLRVESAKQLRRIETNSPQIEGRTGEIWLKLIEKDFPIEFRAKAYKPQNADKWYKVWEKYKRDHDRAIEESEKNFMNALAGIQQEKAKNTSKIVESRLLPSKGRIAPPRRGSHRDGSGSTLNFTAGSRTNTRTGASVMRKVRREVKEIASIHGSLSRPTAAAPRPSRVQKAPQAMISDHRRAAQPAFKKPVKVPEAVTDHEARATFISDSEEDNDDDDDDALFDEPSKRPGARPVARPTGKPVPKATPKTGQKLPTTSPARSAATSLLKSRPASSAVPRPIASGSIAKTTESKSRPAGSSSSPVKLKAPPNPASPPKPRQPHKDSGGERADPPPASSPVSSPPPRPPKRKGADIFMRPKKRVH